MRKKLLLAVYVLVLVLMINGCGYDINMHSERNTPVPISPVAMPSGPRDSMNVTLYYRYADEPMLSSQTKPLDFPVDERVEKFVIDKLLEGPGEGQTVLTPLFNEGVTVRVEDSGRMLMVTLSKEYLDLPKEAPADWQEHPYWSGEIKLRRQLGLFSIVNTITEMGRYDKVQLYVDSGTDGFEAGRIYSHELGLAAPTDRTLLSAVSRETAVVLTPRNVASIVLSTLGKRDWERLYKYIAQYDTDNTARPSLEETISSLLSQAPAIAQDYAVYDVTVSSDGQQATVCAGFTLLFSDDRSVEKQNVPLKLVREDETWKIVYSSLNALIKAE